MKCIPYNKHYSCGGASSSPTILNWGLLMFFITLMSSELCTLDHHYLLPLQSRGCCSLEWQREGFSNAPHKPVVSLPTVHPCVVGSAPSASVSTSATSHPLSCFGTDTAEALQVLVCHWLANGRHYSIVWSFDSSLLKKWSTNTRIACFVKNLLLSCDKKCLKELLACPSFALLQLC